VTFAAGSADVDAEMGKRLTDVAGFLKKAPMVKFALAPVAAARDLESLKEQEVTLRIQRLQRERTLPDFIAAERLVPVAAPGASTADVTEGRVEFQLEQ